MKFTIVDSDIPEFLKHFMIEGAAKLADGTGRKLEEIWPEMFEKDGVCKEWDLEVTLNGVKLPARSVFYHLEEQTDEWIARKAVALIKEKYNDVDNLMYDIEQLIIGRIQKDYPKFRLNEEDY